MIGEINFYIRKFSMNKARSYWQGILDEVLNKGDLNYSFLYTNLGPEDRGELEENTRDTKRDRVYLNGEFSGIYLTPRECDCLYALASGRTVKTVARELYLSHRTVEFYLKNLKAKFGCSNKGELLALVAETDLLTFLESAENL